VCGLALALRLRLNLVIWVSVEGARRLRIRGLLLDLKGDFLRRIRVCRVWRPRGMVFLCEYRGQVRATGCRIRLLLVLSDLCLLEV
jgi:hypothetical protein